MHQPKRFRPGHFHDNRTPVVDPNRWQTQDARAPAISGEMEAAAGLNSWFPHARAAAMMLCAALALAGDARAEPVVSNPPPAAGTPAQSKPKAAPTAPATPALAQQPTLPGIDEVLYLIRSALLTLNDANRSGNYSVLRDLAAPEFRARNTAADLAGIFADLRRRHFDLFAVALSAPQLTASPALNGNGLLRLTGTFPTRPLQINFDLVFQVVDGRWCLDGIAVATPEAPPLPQAAQQPASPPPQAPKKPAPRPK
jgi:hypothetical protein